ncbi:MAG: hypothetical protein M1827_002768 [Pycnora praestabilis]|nr:MAG: hypothetical protein M1827_002768 [Pycnora praestabilis]
MAAALSGLHFNYIALASIAASLIAVDGPLLQRASSVVSVDVQTSTPISAQIASLPPDRYYTGYVTNVQSTNDTSILTPDFARVMQAYINRSPMTSALAGCQGSCTAAIRGLGVFAQCSSNTTSIAYGSVTSTESLILANSSDDTVNNTGNTAFDIQFDMGWAQIGDASSIVDHKDRTAGIQMTVSYVVIAEKDTCAGSLTVNTCSLKPAIIEYPVVINNGVMTFSSTASPNYTVIAPLFIPDLPTNSGVFLGGIQLAASNILGSSASVNHGGAGITMTGSLASQYIDINGTGWADEDLIQNSCVIAFRDPTSDLLAIMNEIFFRTAISIANSSGTVQEVVATRTSAETVFKSHYRYLVVAVAISLVCVLVVAPTFWGWWELDWDVALDPITTANAFNAPLLRGEVRYRDTKDILHHVGGMRVVYRGQGFEQML